MTSVWGSSDFPPKEVARTNRLTRAAFLIGIAGFLIIGFFYLVWVQVVPVKGVISGRSFIGLSQASHPALFSGFNLGAWPTLVFGVILLGVSVVSAVRPSRFLAWMSFISLLVISASIFWQGIGQSPKALGFSSADNVRSGGAVGLLISALAGLVIAWFYIKPFLTATPRVIAEAGQPSDPDLPYAPEDARRGMSTAALVGVSILGVLIAAFLLVQVIHVIISNSH